jgi:hypothetical protein
MSDQDQGDDGKSFLSRWSQRKREAKQPDREAPVADAEVPAAPAAESDTEPEFDLSSLPKLEDLTETTDITVFLRKGVPESLRNAALRKAWALDPAIRNYVNPALDYAYDWNTPGGVPGSGEIGAGIDIVRMVSQIMGGSESVVSAANAANQPGRASTQLPGDSAPQKTETDLPVEAVRLGGEQASVAQKAPHAEQGQPAEPEQSSAAPQQAVRRHGTAKPVV